MQPCSRQEPPLFAQEYPLWIKFTPSSIKKLKSQIRIHEGRISGVKLEAEIFGKRINAFLTETTIPSWIAAILCRFQCYVILICAKSAVQISTQPTRWKKNWLWEERLHSWRNNGLLTPNTTERALAHVRTRSAHVVSMDFKFHLTTDTIRRGQTVNKCCF